LGLAPGVTDLPISQNYSLECRKCGAGLAGIIDPYDEELLLSELEG
jgi:hypothetical protein